MAITCMSGSPQLAEEITAPAATTSILANTSQAISVTVPHIEPSHVPVIVAPSLEANLAIGSVYCTTAGTLVIRIINPTAGNLDMASQTLKLVVL